MALAMLALPLAMMIRNGGCRSGGSVLTAAAVTIDELGGGGHERACDAPWSMLASACVSNPNPESMCN